MKDIDRYHVACTSISGQLCIGRVNKDGNCFLDKRYATEEILEAVVLFLTGKPGKRVSIGVDDKLFELSAKEKRVTPALKQRKARR